MASTRRPILHNVSGVSTPAKRESGVPNGVVDQVSVGGAGTTKTIKRPDPREEAGMTRAGRYRIG